MDVSLHEPRHQHAASEVDDLGFRAAQGRDFGVRANGGYPVARNRDRLGPGPLAVERIDLAIAKDHGRRRQRAGRRLSGACQKSRRRGGADAGERAANKTTPGDVSG